MKYIKVILVSCVVCFGFVLGAIGQTIEVQPKTSDNDSLVHVAYGTVAVKDLAGAISVLNPRSYLDKNYGTYALDGVEAFIGGNNLWNIGNALVLIDGVPRSLNDITANEIEQVSFLKGANAIVLYGSRAANGVILITSKRGKAGNHEASIRVNGGINVPKSYPEYLGSAEYMTYYNQAGKNDGIAPLYSDATIQNYASRSNLYRYPDVDYYSSDYLSKAFQTYSGNGEFSGGNDRARFYALAGFQSQNSLLKFGEGKNEQNSRFNIRGNIDFKLNEAISTYVNISTVFSDNRTALGNYWSQAAVLQPQLFAPLIPVSSVDANAQAAQAFIKGSRNIIDGQYLLSGTQQYLTNPIADTYAAGYNTFTSRQFQYTSGIDVDLKKAVKGLSLHGQISIDYSNTYNQSVNNTYAVYVPTWNASSDVINSLALFNKDSRSGTQNLGGTFSDQLIDFNVHLDYKNTFKEKHNLSAILLASGLRRRQTGDFQNRTNSNLGLQLSYNYDQKYYADFSGALVNSSKLASDKRIAFSPTVNVGWLLSEENFLKGSSVVDRLKLTASAGVINTDLDFGVNSYYLYDQVYLPTAYFSWADGTYTGRATTTPRSGNPNLSYAKRKEVNLGIDGSLFKNKLDFRASAFLIKKDGIPIQVNTHYPSYFVTGFPETSFVPYENYAANNYKGGDIQVNVHEQVGEFKLSVGLAGTYVTSKALNRDELFVDAYRNRVGRITDAIFGLQSEGLFNSESDVNNHAVQKFGGTIKPGDIKYKDQNQDGVIDDRDEVMIGRWSSPFTSGLNVSAQFKGFTLFVLATGSFGGTGIRNGSYYWVSGATKYSALVRDSWTEATKNTATYPRLSTLGSANNFRPSDFWSYNTDRINISRVQLTYELPGKVVKNLFLKGINIYASGSNLLTIAKNREIMELNIGTTPQTRFYNLGIKADF